MALADRLVDLLDLGEEGIEACRERVQGAAKSQVAARSQQPVRLSIATGGVEPVPGGRGVNELERPRLAFPILEGRDVELVSRRLGCIIDHPVYAGIDLAALCVRHAKG